MGEASALGVPLCAAACIIGKLQLRKGERLVVTGANGQVGRLVMALAKWKGASTVALIRRDVELQHADHKVVSVVDQTIIEKLRGIGDIHAIVDTVGIGGEYFVEVLAQAGRL